MLTSGYTMSCLTPAGLRNWHPASSCFLAVPTPSDLAIVLLTYRFRMNTGLISFTVLLLLLPGCSRQRDQKTAQGDRKSGHIASLPSASSNRPESLTKIPSPAQTPDASSTSRPSPFADHSKPAFQQPVLSRSPSIRPAPSVAATSSRPKLEAKSQADRQAPKPFIPLVADTSGTPVPAPMPPAPPAITRYSAPALFPGPKICCVGKATVEPARPARLKRLLGRIPGLRRIHQNPENAEGYVPPQPVREISLVLPPEARASLTGSTMDLKASVDQSGRVTRVELLSPKDEELIRVAADAASGWPFVPAKVNDIAMPSEVILHFTFGGN
jgi:hypothetical protein